MSVKVVQREGQDGTSPSCHPHLLPCEVSYTGAAPVSAYFRPSPVDASDDVCHFRGRELRGRKLPLPAGYTGLVRSPLLPLRPATPRGWLTRASTRPARCCKTPWRPRSPMGRSGAGWSGDTSRSSPTGSTTTCRP